LTELKVPNLKLTTTVGWDEEPRDESGKRWAWVTASVSGLQCPHCSSKDLGANDSEMYDYDLVVYYMCKSCRTPFVVTLDTYPMQTGEERTDEQET